MDSKNTPKDNLIASGLSQARAQRRSLFEGNHPQSYRLFHGIAEAPRGSFLEHVAIDVFGASNEAKAWIATTHKLNPAQREGLSEVLQSQGLKGAVIIDRSNPREPQKPTVLFGDFTQPTTVVDELGARYEIRWLEAFQSGLFLDHAPLRAWLQSGAGVGKRFLNTFCFTGSLSVSAAIGARLNQQGCEITSIDLSQPVLDWAKVNASLNQDQKDEALGIHHQWIRGDVFDWLERFRKKQTLFDTILLDPPSFSRSRDRVWSTSKMLEQLIEASLPILAREGWWMLSVNTEKMLPKEFRSRVEATLQKNKWHIVEEKLLPLPPTFPTKKSDPETQILKSICVRLDRKMPIKGKRV